MKPIIYILLIIMYCSACNKRTTVNNYIDNDHMTAYVVDGLRTIKLSTEQSSTNMQLAVTYENYNQKHVVLSVSDLPAGITIDTNFVKSGYPTFYTFITFYDTNFISPVKAGTYPVKLTVNEDDGTKREFPFDINVTEPDMIAGYLFGGYPTCKDETGSINYSDSVYMDSTVTNKIWFINFCGTGQLVQAMVTRWQIIIPYQQVGGMTISGASNSISGSLKHMDLTVKINNRFYKITMQ